MRKSTLILLIELIFIDEKPKIVTFIRKIER